MKRIIILEVDDTKFMKNFEESGQAEEGTGIAYLMMPWNNPYNRTPGPMLRKSGVRIVLDKEVIR